MRITRTSAIIHKWLALVVAVPVVFWFASGLFFAAAPIERVRSEHRKADTAEAPVALADTAAGLIRIAAADRAAADRIEVRRLLGRPVALLAAGKARPRLYDLATAVRLSPLPARTAVAIAERDLDGPARALGHAWVTAESPEYRGALPAWRVDFDDGTARSLYVAADTGLVTARRSTLWRVFDLLWGLHILDLRDHEDFNTPLLVIAAALALAAALSGIVLLPRRLGYAEWRRRRRS